MPFDDSVSMLVGSSPNVASLKVKRNINHNAKYLPKGVEFISAGQKEQNKAMKGFVQSKMREVQSCPMYHPFGEFLFEKTMDTKY